MEQIPPFFVGQEVEAVANSKAGLFKKGDRFTIVAIVDGCKCHTVWVSVGIKGNSGLKCYCPKCGHKGINMGVYFHPSTVFRAITPQFQAISFTKVLEEELVSCN